MSAELLTLVRLRPYIISPRLECQAIFLTNFRFRQFAQKKGVFFVFYDIYKALCEQRGVSLSRAAAEIGLSNATVTKWKKTGAAPGGDTLTKVAAYFGVSVDKLLGVETPPAASLGLDDFTYALYSETQTLTEENKQKLLEMARFFRQQQEKEGR